MYANDQFAHVQTDYMPKHKTLIVIQYIYHSFVEIATSNLYKFWLNSIQLEPN